MQRTRSRSQASIDAMISDSAEEITGSLRSIPRPPPTLSQGALASGRQHTSAARGQATADGMSQHGQLAGTPLYMAPELWQGTPATRRSDIYAMGLLLYELLLGRLPHAHLRITELPRFVTQSALPPLGTLLSRDVPQGLVALIDRCVARDPNNRPPHADVVRDELEALAAIYFPLGQAGATAGQNDENITRVAASFLRVSRKGDHLAQVFYQHLFRLQPGLRSLFSDDLAAQHRMLMSALKLCVENLRQTQRLVPYLLELGQRHARYGVQPSKAGGSSHNASSAGSGADSTLSGWLSQVTSSMSNTVLELHAATQRDSSGCNLSLCSSSTSARRSAACSRQIRSP